MEVLDRDESDPSCRTCLHLPTSPARADLVVLAIVEVRVREPLQVAHVVPVGVPLELEQRYRPRVVPLAQELLEVGNLGLVVAPPPGLRTSPKVSGLAPAAIPTDSPLACAATPPTSPPPPRAGCTRDFDRIMALPCRARRWPSASAASWAFRRGLRPLLGVAVEVWAVRLPGQLHGQQLLYNSGYSGT